MPTWPELYRDRWSWSGKSIAWLRRAARDGEDDADHARMAHVMVVGDTQVGKTSLLIRLLGVTGDQAVRQAEDVLRAGREQGNSATSVPIRYRWSTDRDRWLLVKGHSWQPEWLEPAELRDFLSGYRSSDGRLEWHHSDRALEIGLPTRLADERERHPALRVLDLPGLYAREQVEQEGAESIVARFAPLMNHIVFVLRADNIGDALYDKAIRDNPYLTDWVNDLDHYRIVLTHAFSLDSQQERFADRLKSRAVGARSAQGIAADLRRHLAGEIAGSLPGAVDLDQLARITYPVEFGRTWDDFTRKRPRIAALVRPANDLVIEELRQSLEVAADEDAYHFAAQEIALRIEAVVRRRAATRATGRESVQRECDAAAGELSGAQQALRAETEKRDQAARALGQLEGAVAALRKRKPAFDRPPEPARPMKGHAVRALQEEERVAWYAAATAMWASWRADYADDLRLGNFPRNTPLSEDALRKFYTDEKVQCCGECSNWLRRTFQGRGRPEDCYQKMTGAVDDMARWIPSRLAEAAVKSLRPAQETLAAAEARLAVAARRCDEAQRNADAAREKLGRAREEEKAARSRDRRDLDRVSAVTTVINRENREYVSALLSRMDAAAEAEKGWYAVAALRALYDLERMMKDT